ncbi:hypothetical protein NIES4102_22690 [Chondrocystis sp. NIES-4102]|nr:hypothetical protein NIES4102_22690 [Chondrocystis sp. NIES-4102]
MSSKPINILALDFDGVICDGLIEYFVSTKKTYQQIWQETEIDNNLQVIFSRLRPIIETGWEMPILLRALILGNSETEILSNWQEIAQNILTSENLSKAIVAQQLDEVRDKFIQQDLDSWLALHRFYPGIVDSLRKILNSSTQLYIVTTKEGRFVQQLLKQQGISLSADQIIGKQSKRPKYETLRILKGQHQISATDPQIFFVEDRLPALEQVAQQNDLENVKLYLADWGYNLASDRDLVAISQRIQLLSLQQFEQFCQQIDN